MVNQEKEFRFGMVAVKKGYATADQIIKALEIQVREDLSIGKHRRIGVILLEQGIVNISQIDEILQILEKKDHL